MDAQLDQILNQDLPALRDQVAGLSTAVTASANVISQHGDILADLRQQIADMQANGATPEQLATAHLTITDAQAKLADDLNQINIAVSNLIKSDPPVVVVPPVEPPVEPVVV